MKKYFVIALILVSVLACKKTKFSPEGPTDVRVHNLSDLAFTEVTVNTNGTPLPLGDITSDDYSEYVRFEKAFPKAEISAKINGVLFTTGPVNTTYMQYLGQDRITYEVYISNVDQKELTINNVVIEEPLILK
jgi:hypothetical protein